MIRDPGFYFLYCNAPQGECDQKIYIVINNPAKLKAGISLKCLTFHFIVF
jgi:hypothetical protein